MEGEGKFERGCLGRAGVYKIKKERKKFGRLFIAPCLSTYKLKGEFLDGFRFSASTLAR